MPIPATNPENSFLKILNLGLLDRRDEPLNAAPNPLAYGISGADANNLQLTCRDAYDHLKMTPRAEISYIIRQAEGLRNEQVLPQARNKAATYLERKIAMSQFENAPLKPRRISEAIQEMTRFGYEFVDAKSTSEERTAAIGLVTVLHAKSGFMARPGASDMWLAQMRHLSPDVFTTFLDHAQEQLEEDILELAVLAGMAGVSGYGLYKVAHTAFAGTGTPKTLCALTLPMWPLAAYFTGMAIAQATPLAVGLPEAAYCFAQEKYLSHQFDFFRDSLLFDHMMVDSTLLQDHLAEERMTFFDLRVPETSQVLGENRMRRVVESLKQILRIRP